MKLFVLGAILIAVIQDFLINGHSPASTFSPATPWNVRAVTDTDLEQMIKQAAARPNAELYARISAVYEKRGEIKTAVRYLRRAQELQRWEDD